MLIVTLSLASYQFSKSGKCLAIVKGWRFFSKEGAPNFAISVGAALMPPARKAHAMRHYANRKTHRVDPTLVKLLGFPLFGRQRSRAELL
ncbi:MAG: hypothetical protein DKT66_24480 [Candidatus Melainabacteria bacterium]|nr:MAG: hypothetical protein DKT66_24480 [Candidatus Melainabacteria bacterium]